MTTPYRVVVPVRRSHVGLVLLFVVCLVVAFGFYLGWFKLSQHQEAATNKVDVKFTVDRAKIKHDVENAAHNTEQKASALAGKLKQEGGNLKDRATHKD
jgi:hypothetical protein